MSFFRRLGNFFAPLAISRLPIYIVLGQVAVFIGLTMQTLTMEQLAFVPQRVIEGEWWRLATYLFFPPTMNPVFALCGWMLFVLMGNSLEAHWGVPRFNLFLLVGWLLTSAVAFLTPEQASTNTYVGGSVFLAFAYLAPEFELLIFIIPVKIKWLAMITWAFYALQFATGEWPARLAVLASTGNFLLFFARDIVSSMRANHRRMSHQLAAKESKSGPRHRCRTCGKDSDSHPQLDFRYCSKCSGDECYCPEHIRMHTHVSASAPTPSRSTK